MYLPTPPPRLKTDRPQDETIAEIHGLLTDLVNEGLLAQAYDGSYEVTEAGLVEIGS